jgi:hypothetical protein
MKRFQDEAFNKYRERIKESTRKVARYLHGRLIKPAEGPGRPKGRKTTHDTARLKRSTSFLKKKRAKRKTRNKIALASRRINRI